MLFGSESSKILKAEGVLAGEIVWLILLWVNFLFITKKLKLTSDIIYWGFSHCKISSFN